MQRPEGRAGCAEYCLLQTCWAKSLPSPGEGPPSLHICSAGRCLWQEGKPLPPQPQLRLQRRQGQLRTGGGERRGGEGITASQSIGGGEFGFLDRTQRQRGKGHAQGHTASQWAKRSRYPRAASPGFKGDLEQIIAFICKNKEPKPCLLASQGHGRGSVGQPQGRTELRHLEYLILQALEEGPLLLPNPFTHTSVSQTQGPETPTLYSNREVVPFPFQSNE